MVIRICLLFIVCLLLPPEGSSQNCPLSFQKGILKINEIEQGLMCNLRVVDPITDGNMFHTTYKFETYTGKKEKYQIDFYFHKNSDSITSIYQNLQSGNKVTEGTKFDRNGSYLIVKDYRANDTSVNRYEDYRLLFTIRDPETPYVTLNHFLLPDKEQELLIVTPLDKSILMTHSALAKLFLLNNPDNSRNKEIHQKVVRELLDQMKNYKDSVLDSFREGEQKFGKSEYPVPANSRLSELFVGRLNPIFINYYKSIFPYRNDSSIIEFEFVCDENGRIEMANEIRAINTLKIKWFEDSFRYRILPLIASERFENMTRVWSVSPPTLDFNSKFLDAINKLKPDEEEESMFNRVKNEVYTAFGNLRDKEIKVLTKYIYTIKYQSIVTNEEWVHFFDKKGREFLQPKNSNADIAPEVKQMFREKISRKGDKNYKINRCFIKINDYSIAQDMKPDVK